LKGLGRLRPRPNFGVLKKKTGIGHDTLKLKEKTLNLNRKQEDDDLDKAREEMLKRYGLDG
jgi:hypothetical protein